MAADGRVREVAAVFLRLGTIAFGGPAAHIALMREELVRRKGWVTDERFVDLMGATNLIPGPNSAELAIHLGWDRARGRGLVVAGVCFIVPAALAVAGLAWAYVEYGRTPAVEHLLYGVVPAVLAIIAHALVALLRIVVKTGWLAALAGVALAAYLLGVNELLILAAGAGVAATAHLAARGVGPRGLLAPVLLSGGLPHFPDPSAAELGQLFATMVKIGAVLYGSGYVLLAFLEGDFVERLGWLTQQQLLDAVAIGQVTPGPLFTTATFVGYLVAGWPGAFVATVGIFLPSFLLVGLLTRVTDRLRASAWTSAVLDGVNATSVALMAGVSLQLARSGITDGLTLAVFGVTLVLLLRTRLNSAWYIGAGGGVGVLAGLLG